MTPSSIRAAGVTGVYLLGALSLWFQSMMVFSDPVVNAYPPSMQGHIMDNVRFTTLSALVVFPLMIFALTIFLFMSKRMAGLAALPAAIVATALPTLIVGYNILDSLHAFR